MVRPLNDEERLANVENEDWKNLRPDFVKGVNILLNSVFKNIKPKYINDKPLTGRMFLNLAQQYCGSLNNGDVPNILSSLERVIE